MTIRYITETEIRQRQLEVRTGAHRARNSFSIAGMRQLIGNTLIAMGMQMQGRGESRREAAATKPASMPAHGV